MELLASTIAMVFGSKTAGKSDLLCGRNQLLPYIIVLYMIAENITVVITLAPCSDKSESNEAWLSLVPSNPFWLKLIKYEWSLVNHRYSVYRQYLPSSVSERESQELLLKELGMSVSPPSSPWTARSLSASDELPLTLSVLRVCLSSHKETHTILEAWITVLSETLFTVPRDPTNWNLVFYIALFYFPSY